MFPTNGSCFSRCTTVVLTHQLITTTENTMKKRTQPERFDRDMIIMNNIDEIEHVTNAKRIRQLDIRFIRRISGRDIRGER